MVVKVKLQIKERYTGGIDNINLKQNCMRRKCYGIGKVYSRAGLIYYFGRDDLQEEIEKDVRDSMGKEEKFGVANAIWFQENNARDRGKSGSINIGMDQLLGADRDHIRAMGEILEIDDPQLNDKRIKGFKLAYIDLKDKEELVLIDPEWEVKQLKKKPSNANKPAINTSGNYIFYGFVKEGYEAYIGRTENRNLLDPKSDMDRRLGEHKGARSRGYSIILSGGEMIQLQSAQGITEGDADVIEDDWIDHYLTKVKKVRNDKYNVAGRGYIYARGKNAPTDSSSDDFKRKGAGWNNLSLSAKQAMIAFGDRIMDTIKFLHDNPQIQPYSLVTAVILKKYGYLPQVVSHCIPHTRLVQYKDNLLNGRPHNYRIANCDKWNGNYTPIIIDSAEWQDEDNINQAIFESQEIKKRNKK